MLTNGTAFIWPDTHVPYEHKRAVRSVLAYVRDTQPDRVIFTGDLLDLTPVSRWAADTLEESGELLQREINATVHLLNRLRDVYSGRIIWLPGNHEERLAKWGRTRGKGVYGLESLTIPRLCDFDYFRIETPGGTLEATKPFEMAPGVWAIHGERLSKWAGASVRLELERFGGSVVMGHCHRLAVIYQATPGYRIWGMEAGHLMDQSQASYLKWNIANWQMGFGLVDVNKGISVPRVIPVSEDGSFQVGADKWTWRS